MKVLITGATAFAGSHLADYLIDEQCIEVHGIKRPRSREEFVRKEVTYHEADVTDIIGVASIVKKLKPDIIFHLAAQSFVPLSWQAPAATLSTNIIGTLQVLEAVRRENPKTTVHIAGSSEEYGKVNEDELPITESNPLRPLSPYGVSKVGADLLSQQYFHSYGIKVVITRAFNHTGPRRGAAFVTSSFAKQIAEIEKGKEPVIYVGNLSASRDFTDVRDMVKAYWLAATRCRFGEPYNICSGKAHTVSKVLKTLLKFTDRGIEVRQEKSRLRPSDVSVLLGDCSKFRSLTKWNTTIPFEQTMLDLLNYWRERV